MPPNPRSAHSASPSPYPSASTSSYTDPPPPPAHADNNGKKRKKLPSCDSCKLRRVLCMPVAPPGSCPRCMEKGIVCTTTPVVRKKPVGRTGKRIEEARAIFGAADPNSPAFTGPSNTPWIPTHVQGRLQDTAQNGGLPTVSATDLDTRLGLSELSGDLVAHLLGLYQSIPQSWLPLYPRGRLSLMFETVGRRLEALPPQAEVLAHTIIALTSRLSSHPLILGPGPAAPSFEALTESYLRDHKDLRQYGQRREEMCSKLRAKAVRLSWERGTLVKSCEESMACCFLLEMLEGRRGPKEGKPYGSAFVSHLRTLLDAAGEPGAPKIMPMSLGWSALIMREALYASNAGRTSHFTAADDLLLCGDVPSSIEEALLESVEDCDVRDSVTLFFGPMRPYTYHVARLARECSDRVTGTHSRKQPLDERYVTKFMTQLDHLSNLLTVLAGRIAFVLSPAATSAHSLPAPFETERRYIMAACLYTLQLAWSSLCLPLYLDLKRRVGELSQGTAATAAERRRTQERVELLLKQMHQTTLRAARMVAQSVKNAPSLAFLTHLTQERLGTWAEVLMEAKTVEEGGEGITREEKEEDLKWLVDGLKTMAWSWSDDAPLIASLEAGLANLQLTGSTNFPPPPTSQQPFIDFTPANSDPFASLHAGSGAPPPPLRETPTSPSIAGIDMSFFSSPSLGSIGSGAPSSLTQAGVPPPPVPPPTASTSASSIPTSAAPVPSAPPQATGIPSLDSLTSLSSLPPDTLTQMAAAAGFPGVSAETITSFLGSGMGAGLFAGLGGAGIGGGGFAEMAAGMGMGGAAAAAGGGMGGFDLDAMLNVPLFGAAGEAGGASGGGAGEGAGPPPSEGGESFMGEVDEAHAGGGDEWMNI